MLCVFLFLAMVLVVRVSLFFWSSLFVFGVCYYVAGDFIFFVRSKHTMSE